MPFAFPPESIFAFAGIPKICGVRASSQPRRLLYSNEIQVTEMEIPPKLQRERQRGAHSAKIPRIASVIAFLIAGLVLYSWLSSFLKTKGQIALLLPLDLIPLMAGVGIPLMAGIGILRRRVWSAYGYALYLSVMLLLSLLLLLVPSGRAAGGPSQVLSGAVVLAAVSVLFLSAGRSLAGAGSAPGWAWPWIAVSALTTLPFVFVQSVLISTPDMATTLLNGDRIMVQRLPRSSIKRGDIIAFVYPIDRRQEYVRRVIGVPGDRIQILNKKVYLNGNPLPETYDSREGLIPYRDLPSQPARPESVDRAVQILSELRNGGVVLPEAQYFVLGDNRRNSWDSRYWGFVSVADVIGKPLLIYSSENSDYLQDPLTQVQTSTGPHRIRWERFFKLL
jgi:signal peptidase I